MTVTLYSTTNCPYCNMLKNYFAARNIEFVEKLVDQDENARNEMASVSKGFLGVPFTVITKENGAIETVVGFDKGKFDQII